MINSKKIFGKNLRISKQKPKKQIKEDVKKIETKGAKDGSKVN